jgi:hypothetical protein
VYGLTLAEALAQPRPMKKPAQPSRRKPAAETEHGRARRRAIEELKSLAGKIDVNVDLHRSRRRPGARP